MTFSKNKNVIHQDTTVYTNLIYLGFKRFKRSPLPTALCRINIIWLRIDWGNKSSLTKVVVHEVTKFYCRACGLL